MDLVMAKQWIPVAFAKDVREQPVGIVALGERVVVFRTSAGIKAMKDLCIHRGAALSLGKVDGDEIVCPYHGWRFDGEGRCTRIPQQPADRSIPHKACAYPYSCVEAYGIVWIRLENSEESIPPYPEFGDSTYRTVLCGPYPIEASAPRVVENFLDVGHLAFLHEGYLGVPSEAEISDYQVHDRDGILVSDEIEVFQPNPDVRGIPGKTKYVYEVLAPTIARLKKYSEGSADVFSMLFAVLPAGPASSVAYICVSRNYAMHMPDEEFQRYQSIIIGQDATVLESQRPELLPLDLQAELHLTADRLSIAYRRWLKARQVTWGTEA